MSDQLPKNLASAISVYSKNDQNRIREAFLFAKDQHFGQKRLSGDAYITHPLRVATNLANNGFDASAVLAGVLHDVIEDTGVNRGIVTEKFGSDIADIVDGVTKVSSYKIRDKSKIFSDKSLFLGKVENYRKILFAAAKDARVLAVKLYDRLDNIETILSMPKHKQKFYARETIEIFAPIAERLGMGLLKAQLEDKSFPFAYPKEYEHFCKEIGDSYKNAEDFIDSLIPMVKNAVEANNIKINSIAGRAKSRYSLYKKILRKGSLESIHDILALRIIVGSVEDCYKTLGAIHSIFVPMPNKIKDYIARPKVNGYQSIHTTVRDQKGNFFEVQIRTTAMHEAAENGLLAHWNYKDQTEPKGNKNSALEWIKELEKLKNISSKKEFLTELKDNLFAHQIFVFTPKGDIIRLPVGATPVDFAYLIHTSLGHRTLGAKINGKIVPLSTSLNTGDTVEIITGKLINPKEDWLHFVKTAQARHKIKALTKIKHETALIALGIKKVSEFTQKSTLPQISKADAEKLLLASKLPYNAIDKAYAAIGEGNLGVIKFIKTIYPQFKTTEDRRYVLKASDSLTIPALKNIPYELAKCCKPRSNDEVIGYLGKEPIVKIHRMNCKRLSSIDKRRLIGLS